MARKISIQKSITIILSVIASFFLLFFLYMAFIVKAGPLDTSKKNSVEIVGIVESVYEGGVKDLVFKLQGDSNTYYINRGLENAFDLKIIENELIGEQVILWYAKHRSQPNGGGHVMQLKFNDSLYYSEWNEPLLAKKH